MISNQEEDEFVAVRVQDPRMQNEGSWNSYVDFKIFLHTNSKAFTAKTSCVRRRYSEFVWLKKKLQKNAGLVPVPDLPGKSFFSFSNEDFLERRRKGLQVFLDNVVNMTVCLSDSQLHLFLQTQLPVGHIQDCVQGHTPYSVTDAILTYASSNQGFAQAQEDDPIKEPSLTVSYESMESPAPHQPCLQPQELLNPELLSRGDSDPLEELCDQDIVEIQHKENSSVKVLQKDNHLEAIVEDRGPTGATFYLGDSQDVPESLSLGEEIQQRSCQIQTPVEVHSPMGSGFEETRMDSLSEEERSVREESVKTLDIEEEAAPQAPQVESSGEEKMEKVQKCVDSAAILDFQDSDIKEQGTERDSRSQEDVLEVVCSENQVLENHIFSEVKCLEHVDNTEVHAEDVSCSEEIKDTTMEKVDFEAEKCVNSAAILDFQDSDIKEQGTERDSRSQEDVLEDICSENQVLENHIISEVKCLEHVEGHAEDVSCSEELKDTTMEKVDFEPEKCLDSAATLEFKEQGTEIDAISQEDSLEVYSEKQVLENHIISEVKCLEDAEVHEEDVSCSEKSKDTNVEKADFETEKCLDSAAILEFKDNGIKEQGTETHAVSQEDSLEVVYSENQVLENHVISEVVVEHAEDSEELDGQKEAEKRDKSEVKEETTLQSEIHEESHNVDNVPEVDSSSDDIAQQMDQVEQEVDLVETNDDEDSHSSSNESIIKVSDEDSETEDSTPAANGYMKTSPEDVSLWSPVETSSRNIIDLHMNGCPVDKEDRSTQEDEDLHYITDISKSLDLNSSVTAADLTENSDFSIIESSCTAGSADRKRTEQETLSLLSLDASEDTPEVEVH